MSINLTVGLICGISDHQYDKHGQPDPEWYGGCDQRVELIPVRTWEELKEAGASSEEINQELIKVGVNECLQKDGEPRLVCDAFQYSFSEYGCDNLTGLIVDNSKSFTSLWLWGLVSADERFQKDGWIDLPRYTPPASVPKENWHLLPSYPHFNDSMFQVWKAAAAHLFTLAGMRVADDEIRLILYWGWK